MGEEIKGYGAKAVRPGLLKDIDIKRRSLGFNLSPRSAVKKHIKVNNVDLSECICENAADYKSFEDYYSRELKPDRRIYDMAPQSLISPCDGWLSAHFINSFSSIPQGNGLYSVSKLLGDMSDSNDYAGGFAIVITLDEADTHRFIFVDNGAVCERRHMRAHIGKHSFGLLTDRSLTLFKSENFGTIAQLEICGDHSGIQQFDLCQNLMVEKGRAKGRFVRGDAAVVLLFKKGVMQPDDELLVNTGAGKQTRVHIGEHIGHSLLH